MKILLVDDEEVFVRLVETMLEGQPDTLLWAPDTEAARRILAEEHIDVALIDIVLGEEDGLTLLPVLKEHHPLTIPVVVSGHASMESAIRALQQGAYDYLPKPISRPELLNLLSRCREKLFLQEERERATRVLLQMQKLEAVGRVTATIAHDFNNVLTAIIGNTELLLESLREHGARQDIEDAQEILAAARRGKDLTRHILAFSSRSMVIEGATLVDQALASREDIWRRLLAPEAELVLSLSAPDVSVGMSPSHIEHIVTNLLLNAKEAVAEAGRGKDRVILSTAVVEGALPEHLTPLLPVGTPYVRIGVEDHGVGMDEETLARAPEPFFTTRKARQASGTGLSVVFHLVKGARGVVDIASTPGEGTRVDVYLPVKHEAS